MEEHRIILESNLFYSLDVYLTSGCKLFKINYQSTSNR